MKKFLILLIVVFATVTAKAINVDEAYNRISAIPGAALSDVPEEDCAKEKMDWGRVIMFVNTPAATLEKVNKIIATITDKKVVEENTQGNHVEGYAAAQSDGRTRALVSVTMPGVGIVIVYAQGGDDIINGATGL